MQTGSHGPYKWLEADQDLLEFLTLCPAAIVGRYVAITAVDSGVYTPSKDARAAGWSANGSIAYSPRLDSVAMLPPGCCCRECGGFDEWYIFATERSPFGSICHANVFESGIASPNVFQFINFAGFRFSDPQMKPITDRFWEQMKWIRPESYVGDGHSSLVFVSADHELFGSVHDILSRSPSKNRD